MLEDECEDEIQLTCETSPANNKYNNDKYNSNKNYARNNIGYNQTTGEACKAEEKEVCTEVIYFLIKIVFHHNQHTVALLVSIVVI